MHIKLLSCCAFNELTGLQDGDSPKEYMLKLCKYIWHTPILNTYFYVEKAHPSAFYIFNGVVRVKDGDYFGGQFGAVEAFAKFIKKYKLGVVKAGPARYNRVNDPGHLVKGYIWAPSERNLWKWFQENK